MNVAAAVDPREQIASRLAERLAAQLGRPAQVRGLTRLAGGSSNETWAFDLETGDGAEASVPLVLRRSFASESLDAPLDLEFRLLKTLYRLGLPVPQPWLCVVQDSPLQSPFMVVGRAPGSDVRKLLAKSAIPMPPRQLGEQLVGVLADLHAVDWEREFGTLLGLALGNAARREVECWAPEIETAEAPGPVLLATLDWLRANAPANAQLCLVHGDFKANNLLFGEGRVQAVIDWELAHIGDPLEDLAWTMLWDTRYDIVNGLLPPADFLATYGAVSGTTPDPQRLFFWQVFSLFKLAAIFLRGLKTEAAGTPVRPMLTQLARAIPHLERQLSALLLQALDEEEQTR